MVTTLFVASFFLIVAISCVALSTKAAEERNFVVGMTEGVSSANPFVGILDSDYLLYYYLYEYLIETDDYGNAIPDLATSWWYMDGVTAASNGSTAQDLLDRDPSTWPLGSIWEYNLTQGIRWSDGVDFTADDVVYTVALQLGDNYASFWAFQPYTKWIDHVQKVDPYKVRFFFTDRTTPGNPAIPAAYGEFIWIPIMPKHVLEGYSAITIAQTWSGIPTVSTGPFIGTDDLDKEIIAKEKITLVKNPEWDGGLGKILNRTCEADRLIMRFYSEEQTLILDLKTKKLDTAEITQMDYISLENATDKPPELKIYALLQSSVYTKISHFNTQIGPPALATLNPARADPALLRAAALATDRDFIVADIFKGLGIKGVGILTPICPYYYDAYSDTLNRSWFNVTNANGTLLYSYNDTMAHIMDFDVERANEILNASGYTWPTYPDGYRMIGDVAAERLAKLGVVGSAAFAKVDSDGNPRYLEFEDLTDESYNQDGQISEYLSKAWERIGVKLKSVPVSGGVWSMMVYGFQYEFTETYWSGDAEPNYLLYVPSSYSMDGWNEWGTPPKWYDICYSNQAREFNVSKRHYYVDECEKYLFLQGAGFLTTCNPYGCYAYLDSRWTGWYEGGWHPAYSVTGVTWVGENQGSDHMVPVIAGAVAALCAAAAAIVVVRRGRHKKAHGDDDPSDEVDDKPRKTYEGKPEELIAGGSHDDPTSHIFVSSEEHDEGSGPEQ